LVDDVTQLSVLVDGFHDHWPAHGESMVTPAYTGTAPTMATAAANAATRFRRPDNRGSFIPDS
jgi:hypothetical protein